MEIVTVNDIQYIIKNPDDLIEKVLHNGDQWNGSINSLAKSFSHTFNLKHLLNVGCHIGSVALPLSTVFQNVTAIEAYPPTYNHLLENIKINGIDNIETFNLALGDKEETIYFLSSDDPRIVSNTGGMQVITENDVIDNPRSAALTDKKITGVSKKLDDLLIDDFDMMIIDIEGMEDEMLDGGIKKIKKNKPIIFIEIWDDKKRKMENMRTTQADIISPIIRLGYTLIPYRGWDFIFVPNHLIASDIVI